MLQHTATHCSAMHDEDKMIAARIAELPADLSDAFCLGVLQPLEVTLQHTATHCNTLQHTAKHCNTLCSTRRLLSRHAAAVGRDGCELVETLVLVCCSVLQWNECLTATHYNALQRTATHCNTGDSRSRTRGGVGAAAPRRTNRGCTCRSQDDPRPRTRAAAL